MNTHSTLFTQVRPFYQNLAAALETAQDRISMMYFTFDKGEQADRLAHILAAKAAAGVQVRLMVDQFGLVLDAPQHALANRRLVAQLRDSGVQVDLFRPAGWRLNASNRLHCKVCAIDDRTAFIGGSNIGDHYLDWDDQNMRLDGALGSVFHDLFDYVHHHTPNGQEAQAPDLHLSRLFAGQVRVVLTVPRQRCDIRRALLDLILDADEAIYIRNWYFLPDAEILDALRSQARRGVQVNVLLSDQTRVRLIDGANQIHSHKLAKAGGNVYRFTQGYMHAKVAWNDHGKVLFGSANMDAKALKGNFECSLVFDDALVAAKLQRAFEADIPLSDQQTPQVFRGRPLAHKALAYACSLAAPWL
jgi:cardiolipin synthase